MEYPFKFKELLLTDKVLDVLGFTEYWAGCGEFGDRRLDLGGIVGDERLTSKNEYPSYFIYEMDDTEDAACGYGSWPPEYCARRYATKDWHSMYFLHEMYEDIMERRTTEEVRKFIEITKRPGVNMYPYIDSYLTHKAEK